MDAGADSGDILSQRVVPILPTDDAADLYRRVTGVALAQLRDFVPQLDTGVVPRQPQDTRCANAWRKRGQADGRIDWRMAAVSIHNLVRGLTHPYVGAHFELGGDDIKVWRTAVEDNVPPNLEPGKVLDSNDTGALIKAGVGAVRLLEIEPLVTLQPGSYL